MIVCPNCGKINSEDNKFCGECGSKLPKPQNYCPECEKTYVTGEKLCTTCGCKLVNQEDYTNKKDEDLGNGERILKLNLESDKREFLHNWDQLLFLSYCII